MLPSSQHHREKKKKITAAADITVTKSGKESLLFKKLYHSILLASVQSLNFARHLSGSLLTSSLSYFHLCALFVISLPSTAHSFSFPHSTLSTGNCIHCQAFHYHLRESKARRPFRSHLPHKPSGTYLAASCTSLPRWR